MVTEGWKGANCWWSEMARKESKVILTKQIFL